MEGSVLGTCEDLLVLPEPLLLVVRCREDFILDSGSCRFFLFPL